MCIRDSLHESLSGLADGANDLREAVAHLRATLGGSEAVLAVEEAIHRWWQWHTVERRAWAERIDAKRKSDNLRRGA